MSDKTSSFLSFDLKSLMTILIPGLIAITLLYYYFGGSSLFEKNNYLVFYILTGLFSGMVIDGIGLIIEVNIFDKRNKHLMEKKKQEQKEYFDPDAEWGEFLLLTYEKTGEPVGHRYLRNVLFSMKFQLCSSVALLFFIIQYVCFFSDHFSKMIFISLWIMMLFLFYKATDSSEVLMNLRHHLVQKYRK